MKVKTKDLHFLLRTLPPPALGHAIYSLNSHQRHSEDLGLGKESKKKKKAAVKAESSESSTSASLPPLGLHKTQPNRIPELFQSLLPLSHRHLSALIHDKLSHLIHDKSSEGPIETSGWRVGGGSGGRTRGWREDQAERE